MAQLPSVRLKMHPSMFNLMMAVLEDNAKNCPQERERQYAEDLIEKRLRYSRRYPDPKGGEYVSVRMYDTEAAETIWQFIVACTTHYETGRDYSAELKGGDDGGV